MKKTSAWNLLIGIDNKWNCKGLTVIMHEWKLVWPDFFTEILSMKLL